MEISHETKKRLQEILSIYPNKTSAVLPAVYIAQEEFGYISDQVLQCLAKFLEMSPVFVKNTVSFYTMFKGEDIGRYLIQVCSTLSCSLMGASDILEHMKKKLKIDIGETTKDKKFSLVKVECLGSCGTAPVIRINDDYYENLTEEKIDMLLNDLK